MWPGSPWYTLPEAKPSDQRSSSSSRMARISARIASRSRPRSGKRSWDSNRPRYGCSDAAASAAASRPPAPVPASGPPAPVVLVSAMLVRSLGLAARPVATRAR